MMAIIRELMATDTIQSKTTQQKISITPGQLVALIGSLAITVVLFVGRHHIADLAVYGYSGIMLTTMLSNATVFVPAPSLAVLFAVNGGLNPVLVGLAAGLGATIGEMTGFLAGVGGRAVIEDRPLYKRIHDWMSSYGLGVIFLMALIPNPVFDVGGVIAGALRVSAWRFAIACLSGKSLRFIILAHAGVWFFS